MLILLIIGVFIVDLFIANHFSQSKNRFLTRENKKIEMATFTRRYIAITIDGLLGQLISLVLSGTYVMSMMGKANNSTILFNSVILMGLGLLIYFTLTEWLWGQTLGKKIVGIRVVNKHDLGKISFMQALYRNLLRLVDGILGYLVGGLIAYYSPEWQRLGDSIGKTLVIRSIKEETTLADLLEKEKQEGLSEAPNQPAQSLGDVIKCPKCQTDNPINADFCSLCYQKF